MKEGNRRGSLIDGTIEQGSFNEVDLSKLPRLDPFKGAVIRTEKRGSLVDGTVEEVTIVVLPPFFKK